MATIATAFVRPPRVRLSVCEGTRIGGCPRCGEAIVFEHWRDYWRSSNRSEYGRQLGTGAYDVAEEHHCIDLDWLRGGKPRAGER